MNNNFRSCAKATALISSVLIIVVTILTASSWLQLQKSNPLEHPALEALKVELKNNPKQEDLKSTFRQLHLLSRKAYFTNVQFITSGGVLLFVGFVMLLLSLKFLCGNNIPSIDKCKGMSQRPERQMLRILASILIILMACLCLLFIFFTDKIISSKPNNVADSIDNPPPMQVEPVLEVLPVKWGSFRNGLGYATNVNPPTNWNGKANLNLKWKSPLQLSGFNSPVIAGNQIFLSIADANQQAVLCFNLDNGQQIWKYQVKCMRQSLPQEISQDTGYAAPTLVTDGQLICAVFANGWAVCLDMKGNEVWSKSLGVPNIAYGYASSPILFEDKLIVQYDTEDQAAIIAYALADGSVQWQTPREFGSSWSSPIIVGDKVILNAVPMVAAYNLNDGKLVWQSECLGGEIAPGAGYASGVVLAANEYSTLTAIDLAVGTNLWQSYDNLPEVASVVAYSNCVYMATTAGAVSCSDLMSGRENWVWEGDNGFYSSPIVAGQYLFATDMRGDTFVFALGPKLKLLAKNSLAMPVVASLAFVDDAIIIRTDKFLFCISYE